MATNNGRRKKRQRQKKYAKLLSCLAIVWFFSLILCLFLIENRSLPWNALADQTLYLVISRLVIFLPVAVYLCCERRRYRLWEIFLLLFCFALPFEALLPWGERFSPILCFVLLPIFFVRVARNLSNPTSVAHIVAMLFCSVLIILFSDHYNAYGASFWHYAPALAVALTLGIVAFVWMRLPTNGKREPVWLSLVPALTAMLLGFFLTYLTIENINYAFDFSEPTPIETVVLDKRTERRHRSFDACYVMVEVGGETEWLQVNYELYDESEIGKSVYLKLYNGALDIPFMVLEKALPLEENEK